VIRVFVGISQKDVENEVRAVNKLCKSRHPNIVQVFQLGKLKTDGAFYFIDMELCAFTLDKYIQGADVPFLDNWKDINRRVSEGELPTQLYTITDNLLDGLIFIHEHGEVHRDLSPHNGTIRLEETNV
jgi:serine/threonine protein kinase